MESWDNGTSCVSYQVVEAHLTHISTQRKRYERNVQIVISSEEAKVLRHLVYAGGKPAENDDERETSYLLRASKCLILFPLHERKKGNLRSKERCNGNPRTKKCFFSFLRSS